MQTFIFESADEQKTVQWATNMWSRCSRGINYFTKILEKVFFQTSDGSNRVTHQQNGSQALLWLYQLNFKTSYKTPDETFLCQLISSKIFYDLNSYLWRMVFRKTNLLIRFLSYQINVRALATYHQITFPPHWRKNHYYQNKAFLRSCFAYLTFSIQIR